MGNNFTKARPSEAICIPAPDNFMSFLRFEARVYSKDMKTCVIFHSRTSLRLATSGEPEVLPPLQIGDASFCVHSRGLPDGLYETSTEHTLITPIIKTLLENPEKDILVPYETVRWIPDTHQGAIYTVPVCPRIYAPGEGFHAYDGLDLVRERRRQP